MLFIEHVYEYIYPSEQFIKLMTYEGHFWLNMLNIDGIKEKFLINVTLYSKSNFCNGTLYQFYVVLYYSYC